MSKTFRAYDPDQPILLPASLQERRPADNLVYFLADGVDRLDLSAITGRYAQERRGGPPNHPCLMVRVLQFGYRLCVTSSRRLARHLQEDIGFRVLTTNQMPDFRTLATFCQQHLAALGDLFLQVLGLCQQAELVKLGQVPWTAPKYKPTPPSITP